MVKAKSRSANRFTFTGDYLKKMPLKWLLLLNFVLGLLASLAYAPVGWRLMLLPGFTCLLLSWHGRTPAQAASTGFAFAFGLFAAGISWVRISVHEFGGTPLPLAWLIAMLLAVYLALFSAAAGWLNQRFFANAHLASAALCWFCFELLRGQLFGGFPWLSPGYALLDTPFAAIAPYLGVYGVGWLALLAVAALLQALFSSTTEPNWRRWMPLLALAITVLLANLIQPQFTRISGPPLKIAAIQGNVAQDQKWLPEVFLPTLQHYRDQTLVQKNVDAVFWPEVAIPDWHQNVNDTFLLPLANTLQKKSVTLVVGVLSTDAMSHNFNSVVRATSPQQFYYKQHLVPFGEYVPFGAWAEQIVKGMLGIHLPNFQSGPSKQLPIEVAGVPMSVSICYENAFGHEFRWQTAQAELIGNFSNDAWFGNSIALPQHLEMARMRALEAQRWLIRATNTGISASIDSAGDIVKTVPAQQAAVLHAELVPRRGMTPYLRFGEWPILITSLFSLLFIGFVNRRSERPTANRISGRR